MAKFYKLRYTFDDEINNEDDKNVINEKIKDFWSNNVVDWIDNIGCIDYSYGVEWRDKFDDQTKFHFHLHFTSEKDIGTIRKWLTRRWKDMGDERKRAALYSLVEENDIKDVERFYRYVFKQQDKDLDFNNRWFKFSIQGITNEKMNLFRKCANEEWRNLVDINRKKRDTQLQKDSTYDKICKYLKDKEIKGHKDISNLILDFYLQEGMSINVNTIAGYVLTYGMNKGFIDKDVALKRLEKIMDI